LQNQFIFKVIALLTELKVALSGADAAKIILVAQLAEASKVRRDNVILRRAGVDCNEQNFRVFGKRTVYEFLCIRSGLSKRWVHFLGFNFPHAGDGLITSLLGVHRVHGACEACTAKQKGELLHR